MILAGACAPSSDILLHERHRDLDTASCHERRAGQRHANAASRGTKTLTIWYLVSSILHGLGSRIKDIGKCWLLITPREDACVSLFAVDCLFMGWLKVACDIPPLRPPILVACVPRWESIYDVISAAGMYDPFLGRREPNYPQELYVLFLSSRY